MTPIEPKPKRSGLNIFMAGFGVLLGLLLIAGIAGSCAKASTPAKPAPVPVTPVVVAAPPAVATPLSPPVFDAPSFDAPVTGQATTGGITDGTYEVGAEIVPGKYKSDGGQLCYWARLKGEDEIRDLITNHLGDGKTTVVIKPSDRYFKTDGCAAWALVPS